MARRILIGILIFLSSLFLMASAVGIGLIWIYNEPLTRESVARLQDADNQLVQAQTAIRDARAELDRTLRIVDAAEKALSSLKSQTEQAQALFEQFNQTINSSVIPGLQSTRGGLDGLKGTIQGLRETLGKINTLPLLGLDIPGDQVLANLIDEVDKVDTQIKGMQDLAARASTFTSDTSYVLGGDLTETRQHINELRVSLIEYDRRVTALHVDVRRIILNLPRWIDELSAGLTIFLLWFGFSQYSLLLHGVNLRKGENSFYVPRRQHRLTPMTGDEEWDQREEWEEREQREHADHADPAD